MKEKHDETKLPKWAQERLNKSRNNQNESASNTKDNHERKRFIFSPLVWVLFFLIEPFLIYSAVISSQQGNNIGWNIVCIFAVPILLQALQFCFDMAS